MAEVRNGPTCLCGVGTALDKPACPVHGSQGAAQWLQPPPDMKPEPRPRAQRRTRADAMAEKQDARKLAEDGKVHPGQCPRCGTAVLFTRKTGLLYVVDAIPVPYHSTWQSYTPDQRVWGNFVVVRGLLKAVMHRSDVEMYKAEFVHQEHVSCGRVVPRLTELPKPEKEDSDVPPFDVGLKPWRCWDCQELIPPERQAIVIQYDGPEMSYYHCHCDKDCQPVGTGAKLGQRKQKFPKINPRTMKYEEPKKGEVLPGDA